MKKINSIIRNYNDSDSFFASLDSNDVTELSAGGSSDQRAVSTAGTNSSNVAKLINASGHKIFDGKVFVVKSKEKNNSESSNYYCFAKDKKINLDDKYRKFTNNIYNTKLSQYFAQYSNCEVTDDYYVYKFHVGADEIQLYDYVKEDQRANCLYITKTLLIIMATYAEWLKTNDKEYIPLRCFTPYTILITPSTGAIRVIPICPSEDAIAEGIPYGEDDSVGDAVDLYSIAYIYFLLISGNLGHNESLSYNCKLPIMDRCLLPFPSLRPKLQDVLTALGIKANITVADITFYDEYKKPPENEYTTDAPKKSKPTFKFGDFSKVRSFPDFMKVFWSMLKCATYHISKVFLDISGTSEERQDYNDTFTFTFTSNSNR